MQFREKLWSERNGFCILTDLEGSSDAQCLIKQMCAKFKCIYLMVFGSAPAIKCFVAWPAVPRRVLRQRVRLPRGR